MFSTLSSFLPPALQLGAQDKTPPTPDRESILGQPHLTEEPQRNMGVDEQGVKKRKERTHESFIVVRPPPSKTNHPLNLQVQLVPPSAKDKDRSMSSRRSFDSTTDVTEDGIALTRTSSNRSDVSMYSGYTSVTSFSSVGSTASSTSSRRMIIPLYNLQAHNVMTNVIVDAGTDAKVAKFQRRGLEVIGLAVLEPIEVWPGASVDSDFGHGPSIEGQPQLLGVEPPHTATSSAVSLTSDTLNTHSTHDSSTVPTTPLTQQLQQQSERNAGGGARKFFGKMFKKKGSETSSGSGAQPPPPLPLHVQQEQTTRSVKRSSLLLAASQLTSHLPSPSSSTFHPQSQVLHSQGASGNGEPPPSATVTQYTILGIQPVLSSPVYPPRGRHPKAYVWIVRRWLKNGNGSGSSDGFLGMINDRMSAPGTHVPVEVRFEWTRARGKGKGSRGRRKTEDEGRDGRRDSKALSSNTPSTSSFAQQTSPTTLSPEQATSRSPKAKISRMERSADRESRRSKRSSFTHSEDGQSPHRGPSLEADVDDGEESDPEDSETPWTCSIVLRSHPSTTSPSFAHSPTQNQPPQEVRLRVGAIVPAPHHPKVVALLKIPFPLPDIEVDKALVRKRVVTPAGVARPATAPASVNSPGSPPGSSTSPFGASFRNASQAVPKPALILTAEEIKDIVSCTALWLVVREGFGGVGKEKRKGDGWRIRG
ncbi:unnamed protein product [Somion occarium]|uniref:Uncharacterized protein n=1 Tax=Somion occarium TaxID=3059160 RepID=A0ABP1CU44_9APHY